MNDAFLGDRLTRHQARLDQMIKHLDLPENQRIYCQKGCPNCCSLVVNCSFPEAVTVAKSLTGEQRKLVADRALSIRNLARQSKGLLEFLRGYRNAIGSCALLDAREQSCSVYAARPLTCRALLSTRPSAWCGVDLATLHPLEKEAFLSSLDRDLVSFPTHYLAAPQELASEYETDLGALMQKQFGHGLSGNLIYQVWLEQEHQLSAKLARSGFNLVDYLERQQLFHPLLLQVRTSQ